MYSPSKEKITPKEPCLKDVDDQFSVNPFNLHNEQRESPL